MFAGTARRAEPRITWIPEWWLANAQVQLRARPGAKMQRNQGAGRGSRAAGCGSPSAATLRHAAGGPVQVLQLGEQAVVLRVRADPESDPHLSLTRGQRAVTEPYVG